MDARAILVKLRDGTVPEAEELRWFAAGLASGKVSAAQAGAFAMAVVLNGLGEAGRVALTQAMRDSGECLHWDLPGPVLDKHSTGGVGDAVSLLLAPALAACGAYVPMISGRGLGHTGGTLDKLEALDGLRTDLSEARLRAVIAETGCAIVGATAKIAPADKVLYAVRDVTATVESVDLICASILSKKLAAGLDGLVLDVKTGSGAFMKSAEDSAALARALVSTAQGAGCPCEALITDMSQPLAPCAGNALEVAEVLRVLTGPTGGGPTGGGPTGAGGSGRLRDLTVALGGVVLAIGGLAEDRAAGEARIEEALASGKAAERFGQMVAAQGGPRDVLRDGLAMLPEAPVVLEVVAQRSGYLAALDTHALGLAVVSLGGGRAREDDKIDPSVGLSDIVALGTKVTAGQPLMRVHAAREDKAMAVRRGLQTALTIANTTFAETSEPPVLIQDHIS